MIPIVVLFLLFVFIFFGLSMYFENHYFVYLSSLIIVLLGIYTMVYGLMSQVNWFTRSLATLFLGLGMYLMVAVSLNLIEEEDD